MEFSPNNNIVQRCLQGMNLEANGKPGEAAKVFMQAWNEAENDFEKFLAAWFVARHQLGSAAKLTWLETALQFALQINNQAVASALSALYAGIAGCYEDLNDPGNAQKNHDLAFAFRNKISDKGPFYHGTRAGLQPGNLLTAGGYSNYKSGIIMNHIYFTANISGAGLAAALAKGDGRERVYMVEPTGHFENDPNVTDKKFPGNLTRSYRSEAPLRIIGEVMDWAKQTPGDIQRWREKLANSKGEIIN